MNTMYYRKTMLSKEFVASFSRLFFEEKIQKKEENAKEKELTVVQC